MNQYTQTPKRPLGLIGWLKRIVLLLLLGAAAAVGYWFYQSQREVEVLKKIVSRLTAEQRVAEVWVEEHQPGTADSPGKIRLKVLEYDSQGKALGPVYCTFSLNDVIHFEALVIRLNDELIMEGQGKSIYLFRRAFALDDKGDRYESCEINRPMEIPGGYSLGSSERRVTEIERERWKMFWTYALDEERRKDAGVKNAQIEAPATRFVPDKIYRLILEHDGGLYIQARSVPEILKGEHIKIRTPDETGEVKKQ